MSDNLPSPDSPFRDPAARFEAGRQGMVVLLISVAMLFAASLVGYFVIRLQPYFREEVPGWPDDLPPLPRVLLLSTLVLAVSSVTMQGALNAIRRGLVDRLKRLMLATTLLGMLFLAMQANAWIGWLVGLEGMWENSEPHRWALASFWVLTGIHAAHVIGGLIPMVVVTARAWRGRYDASYFPGVHYSMMYWHFLGVVWVILYLTLLVGT